MRQALSNLTAEPTEVCLICTSAYHPSLFQASRHSDDTIPEAWQQSATVGGIQDSFDELLRPEKPVIGMLLRNLRFTSDMF